MPEPQTQPAQPPTRTQLLAETFFDQVENLVSPASQSAATPAEADLGSNILWGAAAAAALAAFAVQVEQKRREDAERAAQESAEQADDVRAKRKAKKMAKLEKQWAEENFKQQAFERWKASQAGPSQPTASETRMENKMERLEAQETAAWSQAQAAKTERAIETARAKRMEDKMERIEAEVNIPVFVKNKSETDLVKQYQQFQGQTNYCASYSISTALNILYGTKTTGLDVVNSVALDSYTEWYPRYTWLPDGSAALPYQQARIVNDFSAKILGQQNYLPTAEVKNLRLDELQDLIANPNKVVLMTYNTVPGNILSGHVVVLAGYEPGKGFGFLNSGADRPPVSKKDSLTWKSLDQMEAILQDQIGLENAKTNPQFIVITKP